MSVGELHHRITIESREDVPDEMGGVRVGTWSNFLNSWARIEPTGARERYFAQSVRLTVTHKITMRVRPGVVSSMRVVHKGRIFQIHGVRKFLEDPRWMILDCEEGVAS